MMGFWKHFQKQCIKEKKQWISWQADVVVKASAQWSERSHSLRFFCKAVWWLERLRAVVLITALGIIQLNTPSVPAGVLPPLPFSLTSLKPVKELAVGGGEGQGADLAGMLHDPVIWLGAQPGGLWSHPVGVLRITGIVLLSVCINIRPSTVHRQKSKNKK